MNRALFTSVLTLGLLVPVAAIADVAPAPTVLHVEGRAASVTATDGPDRATFTFHNRSDQTAEVFLHRAILRVDGMLLPMEIARVQVDGRPHPGRNVAVPANGRVHVTVFFELPERHRSRDEWDIDLRIATNNLFGGWESSPAHLTRAPRARGRKWLTGSKDRAATRREPRR